jgi:hypothetical protein
MRRYAVCVSRDGVDYYVVERLAENCSWSSDPADARTGDKRDADVSAATAAKLVAFWHDRSWGVWIVGTVEVS